MNLLIIAATVIASFTAFNKPILFEKLKFNAYAIRYGKDYHRFLSHGLIHVNLVHLLVNMFILYSFGRNVEPAFQSLFGTLQGSGAYAFMYIAAIAFSTLVSYGRHKNNPSYNAVGASGAVSAVVFASILMHPQGSIMFIFLPIPIPSPVFGVLYLVYSAYMARRAQDNIGHDAHFYGALFGFLFPILLQPWLFTRFIGILF